MQLVGAAGRPVELTLLNGEGHGRQLPGPNVGSPSSLSATKSASRYQDWVRANRRTVREASEGTFGYLHSRT